MDEEHLKAMARSGKYIPGVYNYCDRWCERCPLASPCMVRATELEAFKSANGDEGDGGTADDATNQKFWNALAESFAMTRRMIEDHCKQMGIVLSDADLMAAGEEVRQRRGKVRRSSLSKRAMKYAEVVEKWFAANPGLMEEKQKALQSMAAMALPGHDPAADADQIVDAVEIIRWYQFFVAAKSERAVGGLVDLEEDGADEAELHESDANGSAKIALIAIDRSLAAWSHLRDHFPEAGDGILDILVLLDQHRRQLEAVFPTARNFKRPGFDDPAVMGALKLPRQKRRKG